MVQFCAVCARQQLLAVLVAGLVFGTCRGGCDGGGSGGAGGGGGATGGSSGSGRVARKTYPFSKKVKCGTVNISVSTGAGGVTPGALVFEFKKDGTCDCSGYGWIQHVANPDLVDGDTGAGPWRYDNGTLPQVSTPGRQGASSDPSQPNQPITPPPELPFDRWEQNPWYGGKPAPDAGDDFAEHPTPQEKIGDKPTAANTTFRAQVVCIPTGEVLFTWVWGPFNGSQPLDQVPGRPGSPP